MPLWARKDTTHLMNPTMQPTMHATGPRTEEGKSRSRWNAVKHGLSGHTVLLHPDEKPEYLAHCQSYRDLYQPANRPEEVLVQCIADGYWRLLRGQAIELNQAQHLQGVMGSNLPILMRNGDKMLANIALYLQRIERSIKHNTQALREMQDARKAATAEAKPPVKAKATAQPSESKPSAPPEPDDQEFVYSEAEIELVRKALQAPGAEERLLKNMTADLLGRFNAA